MFEQEGTTNIEGVVKPELIEIEEEFCARNMNAFRENVNEALSEGRWHFVIDFSKTKAVDSASLEMLLWAVEEIQGKGGLVKICCLGDVMKKVFEITQFDRIFEVFDDVMSAVKTFS
jgi:anti-sigma B factor antagonist